MMTSRSFALIQNETEQSLLMIFLICLCEWELSEGSFPSVLLGRDRSLLCVVSFFKSSVSDLSPRSWVKPGGRWSYSHSNTFLLDVQEPGQKCGLCAQPLQRFQSQTMANSGLHVHWAVSTNSLPYEQGSQRSLPCHEEHTVIRVRNPHSVLKDPLSSRQIF